MNMISAVLSLILSIIVIVVSQDVFLTIPQGTMVGRLEYSLRGITFYRFLQIPYAQPPMGNLRFQPPQPAGNWLGTLEARFNNKMCYQRFNSTTSDVQETEDCLYLNVYTPKYPNSTNLLPVMFYIHGGGFAVGLDAFGALGPHYFMEDNVIVVTIQYRLGPFGFLTTGDLVIPGNFGLKDQNLALKWVNSNIRYFGGDPSKVTIFGQSAGGASVTLHLASSLSNGLYRAAISQSGSLLCPFSYQRAYIKYAYGIAQYVDSSFSSTATSTLLLQYLLTLTAEQIRQAHGSFQESLGNIEILNGFWFTPTIELPHNGAFLTQLQYTAISTGQLNRVPFIIGMCSEEMLSFGTNLPEFLNQVSAYDSNTSLLVPNDMHITDQNQQVAVGQIIRNIYTPGGLLKDNPGKAIEYFSDTAINRAVIQTARIQSQFAPLWLYQFSYSGFLGTDNVFVPGAERVAHSDDLHYLWVTGNNSNLNSMPPGDIQTSVRFRTFFTNFAKTLNPTPLPTILFSNIIWLPFQPLSSYMNINNTLSIRFIPKADTFPGWLNTYNQYGVRPFDTY